MLCGVPPEAVRFIIYYSSLPPYSTDLSQSDLEISYFITFRELDSTRQTV